jgi:hypothetical protein
MLDRPSIITDRGCELSCIQYALLFLPYAALAVLFDRLVPRLVKDCLPTLPSPGRKELVPNVGKFKVAALVNGIVRSVASL